MEAVVGDDVWDNVFPNMQDGVEFYHDNNIGVFNELNYTICLACLALYVIMAVKPTKSGETMSYRDSRISAMLAKLNIRLPTLSFDVVVMGSFGSPNHQFWDPMILRDVYALSRFLIL